jgi:hypothetical protein
MPITWKELLIGKTYLLYLNLLERTMNHREKRRKNRISRQPETIRHKQREANRAKLHAKLKQRNKKPQKVEKLSEESCPPLFPTKESGGAKVVFAGAGVTLRRERIIPNFL